MTPPLARYFLGSLLRSPERGRLLLLAAFGVLVSSFALMVLQSAMGGLQAGLVGRSKAAAGAGAFRLRRPAGPAVARALEEAALRAGGFRAFPEYELEALAAGRRGAASPVVVHGVDMARPPPFLGGPAPGDLLVPGALALALGVREGDRVVLASPAHVDSFLGDAPRSVSAVVGRVFSTGVPELDEFHLWARLPLVQNLVRDGGVNAARFHGDGDVRALGAELAPLAALGTWRTWEEENGTLVWALALESSVMVFLFSAMSLLVSLCVTGGLMVFFGRMRAELAGFWILGASGAALARAGDLFLLAVGSASAGAGLALGAAFLALFGSLAPEVLPDVFVDRRIPVEMTPRGALVSFLVPFGVSFLVGRRALARLRRGGDRLAALRGAS